MAARPNRARSGSLASTSRAMRATRGHQRQLLCLFDASLVPMALVDNDRNFIAVNRAARLLSRMPEHEVLSRGIRHFTPAPMQRLVETAWSQMLADGAVAGRHESVFEDGSQLGICYCAMANVLPGQHLLVFVPADWPPDELGDGDDAAAPGSGPLSNREREVLSLVATGATSEEIAERLSISPATVRTHVKNAHQKLGARNRAHAIALAIKLGLIEIDDDARSGLGRAA